MIQVKNVTFSYMGETPPFLIDLSFSIPRGSFVSLIGPNGSGKSTVAKLLNGLLLPLKGQITVDGLETSRRSHIRGIRRIVQLVFQNPENQLVGYTVEEDIAFGLENLQLPWREIRERVDWAVDLARLGPVRSRPVSDLSGGEKQRVALAGVLAMKPQCLVLDEATSMLDDESKDDLLGLLHGIRQETGMTVLQITQNMEETLESDRILVLSGGRIVLDGPPSSIFALADRLEAIGLAPPPVVLLGQELARLGIAVQLPTLDLASLADAIC